MITAQQLIDQSPAAARLLVLLEDLRLLGKPQQPIVAERLHEHRLVARGQDSSGRAFVEVTRSGTAMALELRELGVCADVPRVEP